MLWLVVVVVITHVVNMICTWLRLILNWEIKYIWNVYDGIIVKKSVTSHRKRKLLIKSIKNTSIIILIRIPPWIVYKFFVVVVVVCCVASLLIKIQCFFWGQTYRWCLTTTTTKLLQEIRSWKIKCCLSFINNLIIFFNA